MKAVAVTPVDSSAVALQIVVDPAQNFVSCRRRMPAQALSSCHQAPGTNRCVAYTRTCPVHSAVDCIFTSMHFKLYAALQAKNAGGSGAAAQADVVLAVCAMVISLHHC
jgi:hypothetical protein